MDRIRDLIDNERGDPGRLEYICEFVRDGRRLYRSDHLYLERKFKERIVIATPPVPSKNEETAGAIRRLLYLHVGLPARLEFMLGRIRKNKPLFDSDVRYVQRKLLEAQKRRPARPRIIPFDKIPILQEPVQNAPYIELAVPSKTDTSDLQDLLTARNTIAHLQSVIEQKNTEIKDRDGQLQKMAFQYARLRDSLLDGAELGHIEKKTLEAKEKIGAYDMLSAKITAQKGRLERLVSYGRECEAQISREKKNLEARIRSEQEKMDERGLILDDLAKKQRLLGENKARRLAFLKKIKTEQMRLEGEISVQGADLDRVRAEYDNIAGRGRGKNRAR